MASPGRHIDLAIFQSLQEKIDEDAATRDELKAIVQELEKQGRTTQAIIAQIHNTPSSDLKSKVFIPTLESLEPQFHIILKLSETASKHPFYKWNQLWQREIQSVISHMQIHTFLNDGSLLSIELLGSWMGVPVNLKDRDAFHITIEDYLLALTNTIEELARLAPNAVVLGDFGLPLKISKFIKDVHAGFQLLNLKNDTLRRRNDGIKYNVKKVEDVVYDLSLRGLLPKSEEMSEEKD